MNSTVTYINDPDNPAVNVYVAPSSPDFTVTRVNSSDEVNVYVAPDVAASSATQVNNPDNLEVNVYTVSDPSDLTISVSVPEEQNAVLVSISEMGTPGPVGPSGAVRETFESFSMNIRSLPKVFNTDINEVLQNIVFTTNTGTITKTYNYSGETLTSIRLTGDLPEILEHNTKNFVYAGDKLVSISYTNT